MKSDAAAVEAFIHANLPLVPAPGRPDIRLHLAHPGSGLHRLAGDDLETPYWAYVWGGGAALAAHLAARPETVAALRVLDLGAGSGLVAIAAAKAGAAEVWASEIDRNGRVACALNAAANGVTVTLLDADLLHGEPPEVDLILVGDLFYAPDLAARVMRFLDRALEAEVAVLVGDPGRFDLPRSRLHTVAEYPVTDFGGSAATGLVAWFGPKR